MRKMRALLVGNGVNRLGRSGEGKSWEEVLRHLASFARMPGDERFRGKPFPLVFEAVFNHILSFDPEIKETALKNKVACLVGGFPVNAYHKALVRLPAEHILTTNYDDCLERAIPPEIPTAKPISTTPPPKTKNFSLGLGYEFAGRRIWHIHGERKFPNTIMLGHDHYAGCATALRGALIIPRNDKTDAQYYAERLKRKRTVERLDRWIDVFLTADVDIVGFEFDLTESVLWWLLQFRDKCRRMREREHSLEIGAIRFHDIHGPQPRSQAQEDRNDLLKWFGAEVITYPSQDWLRSYDQFISEFSPSGAAQVNRIDQR